MIGYFDLGPGRRAELGDDLVWTAPEAELTELLNSRFGPDCRQAGDHHLPAGVAWVERAAEYFEAEPTIGAAPFDPLPDGTVS
jgi:hypothetical protein